MIYTVKIELEYGLESDKLLEVLKLAQELMVHKEISHLVTAITVEEGTPKTKE